MITLPHHVEFMSDAWLEEAQRFLAKAVQQRADIKGKSFSLRQILTNAPPHLGFEGNIGICSLRYDGRELVVSRDAVGSSDVMVEGDYQAALMLAQVIGAEAPGVMDRARREVANWFGTDVVRIKGEFTDDAVRALFVRLHDHLGRRTVENPDLAHRAARQGLTGKIREMEAQGYTVIERAISPDFADELRAATLRALLPHNSFSMNWMLYHGPELEQIVQNPFLMTLIDASLGRGAVVASISSIRRGPGPGTIPLHTDYSMVPEPYPEFALTGVGVWAMEDWRVDCGPTWLVPGSHRFRRGPKVGEQCEGVAIEMPKGSVVYFTSGVWHWQGDRTVPGDRVTLHSHFNRGILRSLEPKKVDVQMLHRNPPRLGEMLGEDDWFDKMTAEGRDHLRAAYMHKLHRFTEDKRREILAG
jgi:hypothetical protein